MTNRLQGLSLGEISRRRWVLGMVISPGGRRIRSALFGAHGGGLEMSALVGSAEQFAVPKNTQRALRSFKRRSATASQLTELRMQLAEAASLAAQEAVAQFPAMQDRVLALSLTEPGWWQRLRGGTANYLPLCDAARLADLSGQNIVDAFPARDLAQEGCGGPVTSIAAWLLARQADQPRVLIEVGSVIRATYLPASRDAQHVDRVISFVAAPGANLLRGLAKRLRRPLKSGEQGEDELESARQRIAHTVCATIDLRLQTVPGTWLIAGSGPLARDLTQRIAELRPGVRLLTEQDIRLTARALEPASVALLALFCFDQTPATHPALTGALRPRVLGRITPGSPQAWFRLCRELSAARPVVTLRSAM